MFTSFPPLILGSSHAFLKNSSDQPPESISLSEKNYPRSYPLTIPKPWRGLNRDEHTTRCAVVLREYSFPFEFSIFLFSFLLPRCIEQFTAMHASSARRS